MMGGGGEMSFEDIAAQVLFHNYLTILSFSSKGLSDLCSRFDSIHKHNLRGNRISIDDVMELSMASSNA
jgi:hypothetical protein